VSSGQKRVIISRTDAIGDVVLTLPMAGILKKNLPDFRIIFFGRTYTKPIIDACENVDEFINYDDFERLNSKSRKEFLQSIDADVIIHVFPRSSIASSAKSAGINLRVGTTNRLYHWWICNKLIKLSRRKSELHEAQLNLKLLEGLGINADYDITDIPDYFGLKKIKPLAEGFKKYLSPGKFNLILHPKSHVSSREWSLNRFQELIHLLPSERFNIIISGSEKEKALLNDWIAGLPPYVNDCTGKMTLEEFISFINAADGLVAASTGPLHIAAALNKYAFGLYPPIRPLYPGRWAPLGMNAHYFVKDKTCSDCRSNTQSCHCMNEISAQEVAEKIVQVSAAGK
jgi:heptosyltransferase III